MIPELRLLYGESAVQTDMSRWLGDRDLIKEYEDTIQYILKDQSQIMSVLSGNDRELFERYMENQNNRLDLECQMQFSMAFAMGLRMGALCIERTI